MGCWVAVWAAGAPLTAYFGRPASVTVGYGVWAPAHAAPASSGGCAVVCRLLDVVHHLEHHLISIAAGARTNTQWQVALQCYKKALQQV